MLPIAEIIRNKRREKNVTQDELAQALGVTFQSVSRWENGVAYPDIELIPKIALFFGITTDELLGANEEARRTEYENFVKLIDSASDHRECFEIALKAWERFPDKYAFANVICNKLIHCDVLPRNKALPIVRELCDKMINENKDPHYRTRAIQHIFMFEDEENLEKWDKYISGFQTKDQLLALRYNHRNEIDRLNFQNQINLWKSMTYSFLHDFWRRHPDHYKDPYAHINGHLTILKIIDVLRDPSIDVDGWIDRRAFTYLRLSSAYFAVEDNENGYKALEDSICLYEKIFELPADEELSFNTPVLDLITVSRSKDLCPDKEPGYDINNTFYTIYGCLTNFDGWQWFDSVRDEERFKSYVARIEKYKPEDYKD